VNRHGFAPAAYVYGKELTLPGQLFAAKPVANEYFSNFANELSKQMRELKPPVRSYGNHASYIPKALYIAKHVWLRREVKGSSLEPPYTGPYKLLGIQGNTVRILRHEAQELVAMERVKPAVIADDEDDVT
jgi:hypothetical protein